MSNKDQFLGLNQKRAGIVADKCDAKQDISYQDLTASIHVKHELSWSDLVIRQGAPNPAVVFGCRIFADMLNGDRRSLSCLKIFQQFIDRFGIEFQSGTFVGKLLFQETVPDGAPVLAIQDDMPDRALNCFHIRHNANGTADVFMAFAIDMAAYDAATANR